MQQSHENLDIIEQAYSILEKGYAFQECTFTVQMSHFPNFTEENYTKIDKALKAIRQDFAKILVIMNSIERTYLSYQKDEYKPSYFSVKSDQATNELGCFIEYLFAKYRVILEYVQQILEIVVPPYLNEEDEKSYLDLKKWHKKYKLLLKHVADNTDDKNQILNIDWFQQIRKDRDFILHDGATCLVFRAKDELTFDIMIVNALDDEDDKIFDDFFNTENGLIRYNHFWALHISKLIVFTETVFEFIISKTQRSEEEDIVMNNILSQGRNELIGSDNEKINDVQDVLMNMLNSFIGK